MKTIESYWVNSAVSKLGDDERELVWLIAEGHTVEEAAYLVGMTRKKARALIKRLQRRLIGRPVKYFDRFRCALPEVVPDDPVLDKYWEQFESLPICAPRPHWRIPNQ